MDRSEDYVLEVKDLSTDFNLAEGVVHAVTGASFSVKRGQVVAIVGESGCGKSVTARSIMGMVRPPGRVVGGQIIYHRHNGNQQKDRVDITNLPPDGREMRRIRGGEIAMIFQEPRASLSPVYKIGEQLMEAIILHQNVSRREAHSRAIEMLKQVNIPDAEQRFHAYPHQLSGGMCQRVMIATALSCRPSLLIADEPTTALDVTTQAEILDLMRELQRRYNTAIVFITHDLGVVAEMADEVVVMYLGKEVETAPVNDLFRAPRHPYTSALLDSLPKLGNRQEWLKTIPGSVPDPSATPVGCPFHPRCEHSMPICLEDRVVPLMNITSRQNARCYLYADELAGGDQ